MRHRQRRHRMALIILLDDNLDIALNIRPQIGVGGLTATAE